MRMQHSWLLLAGLLLCGRQISEGAGQAGSPTVENFLFNAQDRPLTVPLAMNVGLLGFGTEDDISVGTAELQDALNAALSFRVPYGLDTGAALGVEYSLQYNVAHLTAADLAEVEAAITTQLVHSEATSFEVDAAKLEDVFDGIYHKDFASDGTYSAAMEPSPDEEPYAVIIINPRKKLMNPSLTKFSQGKKITSGIFDYWYTYAGSSCGVTWVSSRRYVVVDVSAGPCEYGELNPDASGGRYTELTLSSLQALKSAFTLPKPGQKEEARQAQAVSVLSSVVVSAMQHLFVPDVRRAAASLVEEVLVPVIALLNHDEFDPFEQGHAYSIDLPAIKAAAAATALPGQKVTVVTAMHNIHEHESVAAAVMKSMKHGPQCAELRAGPGGGTYLDSRMLEDELRRSSDVLAGSLLDLSGDAYVDREGGYGMGGYGGRPEWGAYSGAQPAHSLPLEEELALQREFAAGETAQSLISTGRPPLPLGVNGLLDALEPDAETGRPKKTRVLPVYVLSLLGLDAGLLIDRRDLAVGAHDMVIALQHDGTVQLPFYSRGAPLPPVKADPSRAVVAALSAALANMAAPYERHAKARDDIAVDFIWAVGKHPFGPFGAATASSQIFLDTAIRNAILASIAASLRSVHRSCAQIEKFSDDFLYDPHGTHLDDPVDAGLNWLLHGSKGHDELAVLESLPTNVVAHLRKDLDGLEKEFIALSDSLFNMRFGEAVAALHPIEDRVATFASYVAVHIGAARDSLQCCTLHKLAPRQLDGVDQTEAEKSSGMLRIALIIGSGATVICVVLALTENGPRGIRRNDLRRNGRFD